MASTYSILKFELPANGEQSGTWGTTTNTNIGTAIEQAIVGMATLDSGDFTTNVATLTLANTNAAQDARALCLNIAAGAVSAAGTVNVPAIEKPYIVINGSSYTVTVKVSGQTGVAVPAGKRTVVYNNGTDVGSQIDWLGALDITTINATTVDATNVEATNLKAKDGTAGMQIADSTGVVSFTANPVLSGGTANGVAYLNGSKVLTTGSALTFDGTNFATTGSVTGATLKTTRASGAQPEVVLTQTGVASWSIYNPPSSTDLRFYNGSDLLTLTASGNLGLGVTPSAWQAGRRAIQVAGSSANYFMGANANGTAFASNFYSDGTNNIYSTNGFANMYLQSSGQHLWYTAPSGTAGNAISFTQAMTLDASGNWKLGTTGFGTRAAIYGTNAGTGTTVSGAEAAMLLLVDSSSAANAGPEIAFASCYDANGSNTITGAAIKSYKVPGAGSDASQFNHGLIFKTSLYGPGVREVARLDPDGNLLVGTTSGYSGRRLDVRGTTDQFLATLTNSNAAPLGWQILYNGAAPNNTVSQYLTAQDTGGERFTVRSNGGIANYSGNNVNLSDRREKTNFAPAKSYLETICAIPVQTFNYADQNMEEDPGLTLGVVAQDVQAVAPELVMESNWGTQDEPRMRLSIYQTDLQYALMKALQELKAEFDAYKATHP